MHQTLGMLFLECACSVMWVILFFPCRWLFFYCGKNSRYEVVRINRHVSVQEITVNYRSNVCSLSVLLRGNFLPTPFSPHFLVNSYHIPLFESMNVVIFQMLQVPETMQCLFSVTGSFYIAQCPQGLPMPPSAEEFPSSWGPNNIPLFVDATLPLCVILPTDIYLGCFYNFPMWPL